MRRYFDRPQEQEDEEPDFGTFLKLLRTTKRIRQGTIAALLADKGWTPTTYTRLENGDIAPRFADVLPLYRAFVFAGVSFSLSDRQQFVQRARAKIERKKTHREQHSDAEWAELRYELARLDGIPDTASHTPMSARVPQKPLLTDTDHLLGREQWRENLLACLQGSARKKLIVIRGPSGIGKSSELNWLATAFLRHSPTTHHVMLCDLCSLSHTSCPEDAFHLFAYTLLIELEHAASPTTMPSLDELARQVMEQLEKARLPLLVLLDHAECLLQENGSVAPCWERLFTALLRVQHNSTLVLASQQWPGWYQGERQFLAECSLPPLSRETSLLVLQQHGLDSVPLALLEQIHDRVGGIPLALEWVAALVKQPLEMEDWAEFDVRVPDASTDEEDMTGAIERLLTEPHIFGGTLADDIAPLLQRIITTQHLSPEARTLLEILSVARIPLAKPALQHLCPQGPRPIKELRRASVLVSYPERIQLLPMVAAAMYRQLNSEQRKERETALIEACQAWREGGIPNNRERGMVVTELITLLIKHHRLVEAAVLLMLDSWLIFNLGNGPNLAHEAHNYMQQFDWQASTESRCGGLLLHHRLCSYLGKPIDKAQRAKDYQTIYDAILAEKVVLPPNIELFVTHRLMIQAIQVLHFEEAYALLKVRFERLGEAFPIALLEDHAFLYGKWSDYVYEQGDIQGGNKLREQAIVFYRECCAKLTAKIAQEPLHSTLSKQGLGSCLNNLGYHLNRSGRYEEALQAVEEALTWREQGFVEFGGLAVSYGEKSQILMELGRFQEALLFDEKAVAEIERCAKTGHSSSQEEAWIYRVNRGQLYVRLGRVDEAEKLLRKALPKIHSRRRIYRMFADNALEEIEQWRKQTTSPEHQLDWRWIDRYRQLIAYDAYWWWAQAGPFTEEEQQKWNLVYRPSPDTSLKEQLGKLISQSRWRELRTAVAEQRQPSLHYPALEVDEIRYRITALQTLDAEISQQEPNAIVRRLYHGAIENEVQFLSMIVATYEGNAERYRELNQCLGFEPTRDEMDEALSHVKRTLQQGLASVETTELSQQIIRLLQEHFYLQFDLTSKDDVALPEVPQNDTTSSSEEQQTVTAQTAKRFFEAVLQNYGFAGWQVIIDSAARTNRIEGAAHLLFLHDGTFSIETIRHLFAHEFAGHVARSIAGERSKLGLLGIGTKNYMAIEEGLTAYQEQQAAVLHGKTVDREGIWLGTLATGLASGIVTLPQTFLELFTFLEQFYFLRNMLEQPGQAQEAAHSKARNRALARCLRTYRGVPNLEQAGVWYGMDVSYLRGLRAIKQAVEEDATVLNRLAVGKIGLDDLPDMQELGIVSTSQPLKTLAYDPALESYILSFEVELDRTE